MCGVWVGLLVVVGEARSDLRKMKAREEYDHAHLVGYEMTRLLVMSPSEVRKGPRWRWR
jgi:hypothetical protein